MKRAARARLRTAAVRGSEYSSAARHFFRNERIPRFNSSGDRFPTY